MTRFFLLLMLSSVLPFFVDAQVGIGTNTPVPSAALEVRSTDKGVLFPRMSSAERNAIVGPATGLMVFDIDKNAFYFFNGVEWMPLGFGSLTELKGVEIPAPYTVDHQFGRAAGIAGSYAAVSAPAYDSLASSNIGAVLVYRKGSEGWRLHQRIIAPDSASGDFFGEALDMSGDYMVVGAHRKSVLNTTNSGKAYVYRLNSVSGFFELDGQLTHPTGLQVQSYFGYAVGITHRSPLTGGVAVIVGAPGQIVTGTTKGSASIFHRLATNSYVQVNTLNGIQTDESFGFSVDIDSTFALVGAPSYDTTISSALFSNTGRVQLNRFATSNYATVDIRFSLSPDTSYNFGAHVKLDAENMVIAPQSINQSRPNSGLYILRRTGAGVASILQHYTTHLADFEDDVSSRVIGYQAAFTTNRVIIGVPHVNYSPIGGFSQANGLREYLLEFTRPNPFSAPLFRQVFPFNDVATSTRYGNAVAADGFQVVATMRSVPNPDGTFGKVVFYTTD